MKKLLVLPLLIIAIFLFGQPTRSYFPSPQSWQHKTTGFNLPLLNQAIQFAKDNETKKTRSMKEAQAQDFGKEPFGEPVGAFADRGDPAGLIIHHGYIIAEWGDPSRVDMTHSVTKSLLSTTVGLAVDKGLIKNVNDTVADYISSVEWYEPQSGKEPQLIYPFAIAHNKRLTWDVMLRQTSDWEGTLWGKPEWADRPDKDSTTWRTRARHEPGAVWEYNDVRVNALALAATYVWRKPLPQVLKTYIMDPIGASSSWQWHGYNNSWIVLDGSLVQSVSGGGHWGGGMFINAYDMGRFGLLTLHKGNWNGKQLISESWIKRSRTPTTARPTYGYMNYFLNTNKQYLADAPASAYLHVGNGTNIVYVDEEHDLVIVARWIESNAINEFVKKVLASIQN
jgi:CubicO group peptidase (beta-lactamase class C family)